MDHKCKSLAELGFKAHSNCNGHGVYLKILVSCIYKIFSKLRICAIVMINIQYCICFNRSVRVQTNVTVTLVFHRQTV